MNATNRHPYSLVEKAMVIFALLGILLICLTMTEFGKTKSLYFILGLVAAVTAVICFIESRVNKHSWYSLSGVLMWSLIAVTSLTEWAGFPILRQQFQ